MSVLIWAAVVVALPVLLVASVVWWFVSLFLHPLCPWEEAVGGPLDGVLVRKDSLPSGYELRDGSVFWGGR